MQRRLIILGLHALGVLSTAAVQPTQCPAEVVGGFGHTGAYASRPDRDPIHDEHIRSAPFADLSSSAGVYASSAIARYSSRDLGAAGHEAGSIKATWNVDWPASDRYRGLGLGAGLEGSLSVKSDIASRQELKFKAFVKSDLYFDPPLVGHPGQNTAGVGSLRLKQGNSAGSIALQPGATADIIVVLSGTHFDLLLADVHEMSGSVVINWGIGQVPGATKETPLEGDDQQPPVLSNEPVDVAGYQLLSPVSQGYGVGQSLYIAPPSRGQPADTPELTPPLGLAPDYLVRSLGPKLTSFVIPDALPGDDLYTVTFDSFTVPLAPGNVLDFTQYVPGGIDDFLLTDIDAASVSSLTIPMPFVHGLTFAEEGLAVVNYTLVPEPSTLALVGAFGVALLFARMTRGVGTRASVFGVHSSLRSD